MYLLWAISCAPLYLGSDLTHLDAEDLKLISNPHLLAIDQAGRPATPVDVPSLRNIPALQVWTTRYENGESVIAAFNLGDTPATLRLSLDEFDSLRETNLGTVTRARDEISDTKVDITDRTLSVPLKSHGSRLFRFPTTESSTHSSTPH